MIIALFFTLIYNRSSNICFISCIYTSHHNIVVIITNEDDINITLN